MSPTKRKTVLVVRANPPTRSSDATGQQMYRFVGIDPGATGSIATITYALEDSAPTVEIGSFDHPTISLIHDAIMRLCFWADPEGRVHAAQHIALERVQVGKGWGACTASALMVNATIWETILTIKRLPLRLVYPTAWRKAVGLQVGKVKPLDRKKQSIALATKLYPRAPLIRTSRCTKPDHNRAEALLLAHYARQTWEDRA
jgi:hypothetical protein